jgi:prevent-host-death family protein
VAEAAIMAAAIKAGIPVMKPMVEHTRYDLVFEIESRLYRVQCKWAPFKRGVVVVNLTSCRYRSNGEEVRKTYDAHEIDLVAVYCEDLDRCYVLPPSMFVARRGIHLRVDPTLNGQRASLNLASQYEFLGAVAQLGERRGGTAKVTGSSPVSSTHRDPATTIGADEYRRRFGWYMERAASGEEFLITRRGRPRVRLTPAAPQQPGLTQGERTPDSSLFKP